MHPNHVTSAGLVTGLLAAALYARGGVAANAGGVLLITAMILDHADGELARMTCKTSAFGHTYDRLADLAVKLCTFVGIGFGLRDGPLGDWSVVLGASAGCALLVIFQSRSALAQRRPAAEAFHQPTGAGFEIEDILYLIAPLTWLGGLPWFVAAAGVGAPLFALWSLSRLWRAITHDRAASAGPSRARSLGLPAAVRPGLAVGVAAFTALVAYHGVGELAALLRQAGFGLIVVAAFHLLPMALDALAWRRLVEAEDRPPLQFFLRARWIGESVNGLLPVLLIGGNVVKARLLAARGVAMARSGASVVVDVTTLMVAQLAFTAIGIVLLLVVLGSRPLVLVVAVGALLMAVTAGIFVVVQRSGVFERLSRLASRLGRGLADGLTLDAAALDGEIRMLHGRRRALLAASGWHLVSWIVGAGEVWLALWFLGHPVDMVTALLVESVGQAVRTAAFAIPGALGVQEGGFIVLGAALGIAPETCLALSMAKRTRELLLGIPGLVAWQTEAARAAIAGAAATNDSVVQHPVTDAVREVGS